MHAVPGFDSRIAIGMPLCCNRAYATTNLDIHITIYEKERE
jgi:hypothetical protein